MAAMYGDVMVEIPVSAGEPGEEATWTTGDNRRLSVVDPETGEHVGGHHEYISAGAVLRQEDLAFEEWLRRWNECNRDAFPDARTEAVALLEEASERARHSDDVFLDVFETVRRRAVPLPRDVFNGPHDRRWVP